MGFALLIIFMFLAYGLTTLFRRWIDIPTLIAVAIGCAVNANIFTPLNSSIAVGPISFSIEAVLYTIFMYTIMVRMLDYGVNDAKRMTFTSIAAILISAFIELVANLVTLGFSADTFKLFSYYLVSSIGTILGVFVMAVLTIRLLKKNLSCYLIIPIGIIASSIIHSFIFYGYISLVNMKFDLYTLSLVLGTIIGRLACIGLSILCYFINKKYWVPLNLIEKEEKIENN